MLKELLAANPIVQAPMTLAESITRAAEALTKTAFNVVRLQRTLLS